MLFDLVLGLFVILLLDVAWDQKFNLYDPCHTLEHYHHALLLLIIWTFVKFDFVLGAAMGLVISEWVWDRKCPFGLGKDHFWLSAAVGVILAVILAICVISPW